MNILVISSKDSYASKRLLDEAKKLGTALKVVGADEILGVTPKDFDVLYVRNPYVKTNPEYLPAIIRLAKNFKAAGKRVVDSVIADGNLGQGKWVDYQLLMKGGLTIPKTVIARDVPQSYPLVLKWVYGFKAQHAFLIADGKNFEVIFKKYPKGELMQQEFIKADYEYKIITVGYKSLPVILRFAIQPSGFGVDFYSACSVPIYRRSGRPINGHATALISLAEKASKTLGRELAKVDILESKGKFYILEVNRFPGLNSFEELTKYNVVKDFLSYLR